jgi:hypothetical protein
MTDPAPRPSITFEQFMSMLTVGERRDLLDWLERCVIKFRESGPESRYRVLEMLLDWMERS